MFENANKNGVSFREAHEERSQGFQDKSHLRGTPAPPDFYAQACLCGPNVDQKKEFTILVIEEGLQKIGAFAFTYCTSLSKVVLPKSIKYTYRSVFADCSSLTDVSLPCNLKYFSDSVFSCTPYAGDVQKVDTNMEKKPGDDSELPF